MMLKGGEFTMKPNRTQLTLRLNHELDKRIERLSREMGVSKNAYILMVLSRETKKAV